MRDLNTQSLYMSSEIANMSDLNYFDMYESVVFQKKSIRKLPTHICSLFIDVFRNEVDWNW